MRFIVSDTDTKNFPKDEDDLKERLSIVAKGLPDQGNNIDPFVIPAFTLFKDCGLITKKNLELLNDERWCLTTFGIKMNPLGGVVRREGLSMWDETNLRYYCPDDELQVRSDIEKAPNSAWHGRSKLAVVCEGVTYYISNDWFAPGKSRPTKEVFFKALASWTKRCLKSCENKATENRATAPVSPIIKNSASSKDEPTDLQLVLELLEQLNDTVGDLNKRYANLNSKVDEINERIQLLSNGLNREFSELKSKVEALHELWK